MKLETTNSNYACQVVKLSNLRKHSNADRLMIATVQGNNVICGLDTDINQLYLYFPIECQLSEEFAKTNDLIRRKNEDGSVTGGMFEEKRRVKCLKLRGEKSEGFICPVTYLNNMWIDSSQLKEGDEFTDIDGKNICQKYTIRQINKSLKGDRKKIKNVKRLVDNQVRLHVDTEQLRKNLHKLELDDYIGIHYKKHGTSWWAGNLLVKRKLKWWEKSLKSIGVPIIDVEYDIIYGSRRVIKNERETKDKQHWFGYDFWAEIKDEVKDVIPKGYTLYGEAIGYTKEGSFIQGPYDYGCKPGEHKTYIYRITITNPDGKVIDLDDNQIKDFCNKYGLLYEDTFLYYGTIREWLRSYFLNTSFIPDNWKEIMLEGMIGKYNDKDCYMCVNKVPEEGVVLRRQNLFEYEAYKLKSFRFLEYETKELDKGNIDIETEQSLNIQEDE